MKRGDPLWRVIRLSWPVLGGAWGVWVGLGGYLALAHNSDSFGSVLALGFFAVFALIGLMAGAASGALIGGSVDAALRRAGLGMAGAVITATLVNALAIWQIADLVQTRYPGLRADGPAKLPPRGNSGERPPVVAKPMPSTTGTSSRTSCSDPPPTRPKERELWNSECR